VERQIVELAAVLCLVDEALGEALPGTLDDRTTLGVAADGAHDALSNPGIGSDDG
jgi:hypothetical protein